MYFNSGKEINDLLLYNEINIYLNQTTMKQFFKFMFASMLGVFLAFLLAFFIFIGIITAIIASADSDKGVKVGPGSVLHIKLDEAISDRASKNPFENFDFNSFSSKPQLGLNEVLESIEKAKSDDNIKGIFLDVCVIPSGIAMIEEIRNKLIEFKESEKFVISYSESYTQGAYYLASIADTMYLNPQGSFDFKGLGGELMFFKGALEKLEIEPQIIRHGKFKSAVEPFMLDKMSEENRKQTMTYIGSIWNHILQGISETRNIPVLELNNIANGLLIQKAEDAVTHKLVDQLAYKDEILEILKEKTAAESIEKIKMVTLAKYNKAEVESDKTEITRDKIAVIYAVGAIQSGEGDNETMGSERISKAIREARLDEKVKAIVLRVNSPGGSALASEVIWREMVLAKKDKPVIVSMGNVAASGGYYIACAADTIVCNPNTITGSIGVFGVLFNGQKFLNNKLGITIDTIKTNHYSDFGSATRPLTASEREIIQKMVENVYDVFITHVAEGRGLTKEMVDSIGQGRVWSGEDAIKIGLVDVLGGLETAIDIATSKANLEKYRIVSYPKQKEPFAEIMAQLTGDAESILVKRELGENYKYYKQLQNTLKSSGIQARMPYEIDFY